MSMSMTINELKKEKKVNIKGVTKKTKQQRNIKGINFIIIEITDK